jgi:hypothetical protein
MDIRSTKRFALAMALIVVSHACGGSGSPTSPSHLLFPLASESVNFRYHAASGDTIDTNWQESYHSWAIATLGVQVPQKIDYYKYRSRQDMGDHTGKYNTNGFAEPATFEIHTLWPTDNHEVVHIYTALIGRPSDFFNEGIAVAFQTNRRRATSSQCSTANLCTRLPTVSPDPDARATAGSSSHDRDFRGIPDEVLSYREAGSFMRFVVDTYGIDRVRELFRISGRDDNLTTIRQRFSSAIGVSLTEAEAAWTAMLMQ